MTIHFGRSDGYINSIELIRVNNHKALPHVSKLIADTDNDSLKSINKIHVEKSVLNHEDYCALQTIFHECIGLHEIKFDSNHIDTLRTHELLSALSEKQLMTLCFTDNWIGEKTLDGFFEFMHSQQAINVLDFSLNWLGDKGIIKLMEATNHNLRQLQLSCDDFQIEGMTAICRFILQCSQLLEIDISYNRLDEKSAKQIALIIGESDCVSCIKANSNNIGNKGAALIAEALKHNTKMISLDVSDNGISDIGAKHLVDAASNNAAMRSLDLRHNSINPDAIGQLIRGIRHPLLEVIF